LKFDQKTVNTFKIGTGLKVTDEVLKYVKLNVLGVYFRDVPVKINNAFDALSILTLLNGNGTGEEAPVIGVTTANSLEYRDVLRSWIRGSILGRNFNTILCGDEEMSMDLMLLKEFFGFSGETTKGAIELKSNVPTAADLHIHAVAPQNSLVMVDKTAAMIKLNVEAMTVESERIVANGINGTYARMRCGFAKMYQDAVIVVNKTVPYSATTGALGGFPDYMSAKAIQQSFFKRR
jgi:hypothetical protein